MHPISNDITKVNIPDAIVAKAIPGWRAHRAHIKIAVDTIKKVAVPCLDFLLPITLKVVFLP
jgi:hypothetical protein